jgi:hypothetical protein
MNTDLLSAIANVAFFGIALVLTILTFIRMIVDIRKRKKVYDAEIAAIESAYTPKVKAGERLLFLNDDCHYQEFRMKKGDVFVVKRSWIYERDITAIEGYVIGKESVQGWLIYEPSAFERLTIYKQEMEI